MSSNTPSSMASVNFGNVDPDMWSNEDAPDHGYWSREDLVSSAKSGARAAGGYMAAGGDRIARAAGSRIASEKDRLVSEGGVMARGAWDSGKNYVRDQASGAWNSGRNYVQDQKRLGVTEKQQVAKVTALLVEHLAWLDGVCSSGVSGDRHAYLPTQVPSMMPGGCREVQRVTKLVGHRRKMAVARLVRQISAPRRQFLGQLLLAHDDMREMFKQNGWADVGVSAKEVAALKPPAHVTARLKKLQQRMDEMVALAYEEDVDIMDVHDIDELRLHLLVLHESVAKLHNKVDTLVDDDGVAQLHDKMDAAFQDTAPGKGAKKKKKGAALAGQSLAQGGKTKAKAKTKTKTKTKTKAKGKTKAKTKTKAKGKTRRRVSYTHNGEDHDGMAKDLIWEQTKALGRGVKKLYNGSKALVKWGGDQKMSKFLNDDLKNTLEMAAVPAFFKAAGALAPQAIPFVKTLALPSFATGASMSTAVAKASTAVATMAPSAQAGLLTKVMSMVAGSAGTVTGALASAVPFVVGAAVVGTGLYVMKRTYDSATFQEKVGLWEEYVTGSGPRPPGVMPLKLVSRLAKPSNASRARQLTTEEMRAVLALPKGVIEDMVAGGTKFFGELDSFSGRYRLGANILASTTADGRYIVVYDPQQGGFVNSRNEIEEYADLVVEPVDPKIVLQSTMLADWEREMQAEDAMYITSADYISRKAEERQKARGKKSTCRKMEDMITKRKKERRGRKPAPSPDGGYTEEELAKLVAAASGMGPSFGPTISRRAREGKARAKAASQFQGGAAQGGAKGAAETHLSTLFNE